MTATNPQDDPRKPVIRHDEDVAQLIRERLASLEQGTPGVPAEQVLADVRERLGVAGR